MTLLFCLFPSVNSDIYMIYENKAFLFKLKVQTITRGLFAGTVLFGVWCTLTVPAQSLQSDLVSGSLITAGSIGIAALAGYA